ACASTPGRRSAPAYVPSPSTPPVCPAAISSGVERPPTLPGCGADRGPPSGTLSPHGSPPDASGSISLGLPSFSSWGTAPASCRTSSRGELRHLRAYLADDRQRCQLADPLDLRQVQPYHVIQRRADVEARLVGPAFRARLGLQRRQGPVTFHLPQLQGDLPVHLLHLPQDEPPGLVGQLQLKEVLL